MFLDKELDVICLLQAELKHSEPLLYKSNSFCKKVSRYIKSINSFSDNSGHEALPPDYYSDELNCMFDVMRVNDTEIRKTYNPVKIRERELEQALVGADSDPRKLEKAFGMDERYLVDNPYVVRVANIKGVII